MKIIKGRKNNTECKDRDCPNLELKAFDRDLVYYGCDKCSRFITKLRKLVSEGYKRNG